MIRALQTVKIREIEYSTIKALSDQIHGLPHGFQLASRERHLIAQGPLLRIHPSEADDHLPEIDYTPGPTGNVGSYIPTVVATRRNATAPQVHTSARSRPPLSIRPDDRNSMEAEDDLSLSETSSISGISSSSTELQTPSTDFFHMRDDTLPPPKSAAGVVLSETSVHGIKQSGDEWIYAFVFTDIVILATVSGASPMGLQPKSPRMDSIKSQSWNVIPSVGLARVLGFTDLSGPSREWLLMELR